MNYCMKPYICIYEGRTTLWEFNKCNNIDAHVRLIFFLMHFLLNRCTRVTQSGSFEEVFAGFTMETDLFGDQPVPLSLKRQK